jgi:hypothetical protein
MDILNTLESEGIETKPLKGPLLSQTLYKDVSQRHIRDLDLLVNSRDVMKTLQILRGMGYILKFPEKELSDKQWRQYYRQQYDVILKHQEDGSLLELHTHIAYPGLLGGKEHLITHDLEICELAGRPVNCFSKEATFLYLAIHGAHHLFYRLFWLRDLSEALNRWALDHEAIADSAGQMGIERMLGVGLQLAESFFGTGIPDTYKPILTKHESVLTRMEERCYHAICGSDFYGRRSRANVLQFYMDMKAGWKHKYLTLSSVFYRWHIRKILIS